MLCLEVEPEEAGMLSKATGGSVVGAGEGAGTPSGGAKGGWKGWGLPEPPPATLPWFEPFAMSYIAGGSCPGRGVCPDA